MINSYWRCNKALYHRTYAHRDTSANVFIAIAREIFYTAQRRRIACVIFTKPKSRISIYNQDRGIC